MKRALRRPSRCRAGSFRIGADLDLGLARIGAGLLFWSESPKVEVATRPDVSFGIGGVQYNGEQVTSMTGTLEGSGRAYFALLGFGSPSGQGLGLFADLGVIVRSGVALRMSATGRDEVIGTEDFEDDLAREAQDIEEGLGSFIDYWPLVVLGVRLRTVRGVDASLSHGAPVPRPGLDGAMESLGLDSGVVRQVRFRITREGRGGFST